MTIEIRDRNGWKFAVLPQARGAGRQIFKALRTRSMEEARELVKAGKLEEIALASRADALTRDVWTRLLAGRNLKVRDTIESYETHRHVTGVAAVTIRNDGLTIDRFLRGAGIANSPVAVVEAAHVADFINAPGPQKLSTREVWLAAINGWLGYLAKERWIVRNPALDVVVRLEGLSQDQLVSNPREAFTAGEVTALLAAVPRADFWHGAILFGFEFGLRLGAVATLEDGNVTANRLRLYTRKGRRIVDEPLSDALWTWLQDWRAVRPASDTVYLFPVQAAIYESGSNQLSRQFGRLVAKHGIVGKSFHGLRKAATEKRWSAELDELGDKDKRALMSLVAAKGLRAVQQMLAHAPGSDVTEKHYLPTK